MTEIIISLLGGGTLATIVGVVLGSMQKANNKAIATLEKVYKDEKKEDKEYRVRLEGKIDKLTDEVAELKPLACVKFTCKLRKPYESNDTKNSKKA